MGVFKQFVLTTCALVSWSIPATLMADELVVTKELSILKGGFVPKVHLITRASNGDYIVGGSFLKKAWAGRVDAQGNLKSQYEVPPLDPSPFATPGAFEAAVTLPDDSVFLCGTSIKR